VVRAQVSSAGGFGLRRVKSTSSWSDPIPSPAGLLSVPGRGGTPARARASSESHRGMTVLIASSASRSTCPDARPFARRRAFASFAGGVGGRSGRAQLHPRARKRRAHPVARRTSLPLGSRAKNAALCGLRLDRFRALLVTGLIACSVGPGSEKSVFDARSVNASATPYSSCPEALFRAASVPALGAQRCRAGT
jgi:hypothetical protein